MMTDFNFDYITFHEEGLSTNDGDQPGDFYLRTITDLECDRALYSDYSDKMEAYEFVGEFLSQDGVWEQNGFRDWVYKVGIPEAYWYTPEVSAYDPYRYLWA